MTKKSDYGKGDRVRRNDPMDPQLFYHGYMASHASSAVEREKHRIEWERLRKEKVDG